MIQLSLTEAPLFTGKGNPLCAETDPEAFFPERGSSFGVVRQAKALCKRCPYTNECLEWALTHTELGIWGGTTERERRSLKRSRRIA
jgi:WhiB family redox-sensing transcriptional regulator